MRRALGLIFIVIACVVGALSMRGTMPFMPIFGSSMEPTLHTGSLILIEPVLANQVQVGDIIVYNVPPLIREHYSYPLVVAHRVIRVTTDRGFAFRTKGDNTGEDPFTIMPWDLRGRVGSEIPYLGLPLLFMQSQQGLIFIIIALSFLVIFLYGGELGLFGKKAHRGVFAPVIAETSRNNQVLTEKIETTEKRMNTTEQALEKFAAAIELYAQHLSSHTAAIQGLSQASQELSKSAAEQNRVLQRLAQVAEPPKPSKGKTGIEQVMLELEKTMPKPEKTMSKPERTQFPPGCIRSRKEPAELTLTNQRKS